MVWIYDITSNVLLIGLRNLGAFQIVTTITNRRQRFKRVTGLGVLFSLRHSIAIGFEKHPSNMSL